MVAGSEEVTNHRAGIALVIANQTFTDGSKRRSGAQADLQILTDTFKQLGLEVFSYLNLTSTEILMKAEKGSVKSICCSIVLFTISKG